MKHLLDKLTRFLRSEEGPTAVEYAMMLLLVFLALLSAVTLLGQSTATNFEQSNSSLEKAFDSP